MGITKRLVDLARANLNALLERAADEGDPRRKLLNLSDAELEAEILRRKAAREAEAKVTAAREAVDAEPARPSAAGPPGADRAAREQAAREREAKVAAARAAREQAAQKEAQARARAGGSAGSGGAGRARTSSGGAGGGGDARRPAGPDHAAYYARLELPVGASFDEVKASYRRLMRRYHPDLHNQSPEKLKAATEVAQALTQAYNELEKALLGGPNRRG